jgi:hypothetical protein
MTNDLDSAAPGLGHNQVRPFDLISERAEALARTAADWEKVTEIVDHETARDAESFLSEIAASIEKVKNEKEAEKRPHLDANREIELRYGPVALVLTTTKAKIEPKVRAWLQRLKAANPDTRPAVRGSYSSRARSLRVLWRAEVDDVVLAFAQYLDHPKVKEVLTELASADARAGAREIPGCRVLSREIAA